MKYAFALGTIVCIFVMAHSLQLQSAPPVRFVSGACVAEATNKVDIDRFPGERELLKRLNSPEIRTWIDAWAGRHSNNHWYSWESPTVYGEYDLLQILQNHGVNICDDSEAEMREVLQTIAPEAIKVVRKLCEPR